MSERLSARIEELEAQLAEATTCGLCGEHPTEKNHLFICCENCTDIGVSNVPKEVFELQRQLAEANAKIDELETTRKQFASAVSSLADEQHAIDLKRAESAEAERDKLRAVLEGAQYNEIDDMLTRDIEVCRLTGEAVHALTQKYIDYGEQAARRIEEAEAELDRLRAALEEIRDKRGVMPSDVARRALSPDARQPESEGRAEGE